MEQDKNEQRLQEIRDKIAEEEKGIEDKSTLFEKMLSVVDFVQRRVVDRCFPHDIKVRETRKQYWRNRFLAYLLILLAGWLIILVSFAAVIIIKIIIFYLF